jgi:hypothetical protein
VVPRRLLQVLVSSLAALVVVLGVLMAFLMLIRSLGDEVAARALMWISVGCLMLLVADILLLVLALGLKAIESDESPPNE